MDKDRVERIDNRKLDKKNEKTGKWTDFLLFIESHDLKGLALPVVFHCIFYIVELGFQLFHSNLGYNGFLRKREQNEPDYDGKENNGYTGIYPRQHIH